MFKAQVNPNEFQYKLEYYGLNCLPVVSASVHLWKWRAGWEPKYTFTKASLKTRTGQQYVQIIICTDDSETANLFYRLMREGATQYETRCDVYLAKKDRVFMRIAEFHALERRVEE